jgi:hypothetical protein
MKFTRLARFGGAVAVSLLSANANAQSVAAADALFQEGQAALERGDLAVACPKLRESDRLDPANGTKLNLADCEEKRGRLATAWELYRKLSETLPAEDQRLPYVKSRLDALAARVPRLTLVLARNAPADTHATLGQTVLTSASFGTALPFDPGNQELIASSGASKRRYRFTLREGDAKTLEINPQVEAAGPPPEPPRDTNDAQSHAANTKMLGYALGGVGIAGFAVGSITGLIGLQKVGVGNDNCNDSKHTCNQAGVDANNTARTMRMVSTTGFVIGLLGVGAGAYLVLTSSADEKVSFGARVNGDSASLGVNGRW